MNLNKKIEMSPMEKKFNLFLSFLFDIDNYYTVKYIILDFPDVYRELLNQIDRNTKIYKLIKSNNIEHFTKIEDEKRKRFFRHKKKLYLK